jgi:hypothetical protein
MLRSFLPRLLFVFLGFVLCLPAHGQDQPSLGDAARQARAAKSAQSKKVAKVITNDDLGPQGVQVAPAQAAKGARTEDPAISTFLRRIAGRWNFAYVRKGNTVWWPDHGSSRPKNQIHYLFGLTELLIESRPEFNLPSITDRFVYGSVRKVSADLFDVELINASEHTEEIKRFKLSPDGKTLEIATGADLSSEPTCQVLELVDANWTDGANRP